MEISDRFYTLCARGNFWVGLVLGWLFTFTTGACSMLSRHLSGRSLPDEVGYFVHSVLIPCTVAHFLYLGLAFLMGKWMSSEKGFVPFVKVAGFSGVLSVIFCGLLILTTVTGTSLKTNHNPAVAGAVVFCALGFLGVFTYMVVFSFYNIRRSFRLTVVKTLLFIVVVATPGVVVALTKTPLTSSQQKSVGVGRDSVASLTPAPAQVP